MNRAYSLLEIKSVDAEQRLIEGIASTPELDRQGDVMDSGGAKFALPLPLLWQHQKDLPIGHVISATVTSAGIHIKAQIAKGVLPFIDEKWALIKAGLIRGLSIGWRPLAAPVMKQGAVHYPSWEWLELSAVTIPANQSATIRLVKALDQHVPAASGTGSAVSLTTPGVSGSFSRTTRMNISEQLTEQKQALQIKSARLEELMNGETQNGGLDDDESTERNTLLTEVKTLTSKVSQLSTLEAALAAQSQTLTFATAAPSTKTTPSYQRVEVVKKEYPKGTIFTRYAMAVAAGKGSLSDTIAYAKRWTDTPEVVAYIKAVEGTSVVASPGWGGELVNPDTAATEFVELVRAATIIGRVPGFRTVPFNIPIITQTGGSTFEWVGEGGVKPVGELAFERTTLPYSKVAGIIVLSEELIRLSRPDAEATVRTDLTEQCARFLDEQFIQVGVAAGPNNPASITNGVASPPATGSDMSSFLADMNTALSTFDTNNITTDGLVIVTTPALARGISLLLTALGNPAFPGMTPTGGTLLGYPVIVSSSVNAGTLVIFKPSEIFLADDGRVTLDASNQATLDMNGGSPSSPTFSLWQRNCVGIRAERWIRWQKRRAGIVAVIDTASYGPSVGSP